MITNIAVAHKGSGWDNNIDISAIEIGTLKFRDSIDKNSNLINIKLNTPTYNQ